MDRQTALRNADFGRSSAEVDRLLTDVFVETDQWHRVFQGLTDVVLGPKGSGKSAIYGQILRAAPILRRRRKVVVIGAESPVDDPIFSSLHTTRGLNPREFVGVWKLYFLAITVARLREHGIRDRHLAPVMTRLQAEGLLPEPAQSTMVELFNRALRYADMQFRLSTTVAALPAPLGAEAKVEGTITLHEPTPEQARKDAISVNRLLLQLGSALARARLTVWILVDRLDTAFASVDEEVESSALRALMQTYIDLVAPQYRLSVKLFLRDDVWHRVSEIPTDPRARTPGGNVIEPIRLEWSESRLLDLVCRRIAHNADLCRFLGLSRRAASRDPDAQREIIKRILPDGPWSFAGLLGRLRDGSGNVAPRELIRLFSEARSIQVSRLELQNTQYVGDELFEPTALDSALLRVSEDRLFQVMCTEYPYLHPRVTRLLGTAAAHTVDDLQRLWGEVGPYETRRLAEQLARLGLFEVNRTGADSYVVAPLYRPALSIRS